MSTPDGGLPLSIVTGGLDGRLGELLLSHEKSWTVSLLSCSGPNAGLAARSDRPSYSVGVRNPLGDSSSA